MSRLGAAFAAASLMYGISAPPTAASTSAHIPVQAQPPEVSAFEGVVAWSRWSAKTERYRLWVKRPGRRAAPMPVPARKEPFDVDVGPNRSGRPVLVYSRCGGPGPGCRIYRFSPRSMKEWREAGTHRAGTSEADPAVWRGRLAFVRSRRASKRRTVIVRVAGAERRLTRTSGPVRGDVSRLDLDGRRLVLLATSRPRRGCPRYGAPVSGDAALLTEILLARYKDSRRVRIVDYACNASAKVENRGPVLLSQERVGFLSYFEEDGKGTTYLRVAAPERHEQVVLFEDPRFPGSLAVDDTTVYLTEEFARRDGFSSCVRVLNLKELLETAAPYDPNEPVPEHD